MRDLSRFIMLGLVTPSLALASACYEVESDASASERVAALSSASCGEHVAAILAGQHTAAGSVVVSNTATDLVVEVFGNTDWGFSLVHVYAGLTPPTTVAPRLSASTTFCSAPGTLVQPSCRKTQSCRSTAHA